MEINKEKTFLSAVIYVNNCEHSIKSFLTSIIGIFNTNFEKFEIICVNDASVDNSVEAIYSISGQIGDGNISIVNMSYNQGLEQSMNAGLDLSIGDFVFEFDSDYADYDMSLIMEVYRRALEGNDIVSASSSKSHFSSNMFYYLFNKNAHLQYELQTEAFRILSRRAINRIHSMSKTIPYRKALYANCGLKMDNINYIRQVPVSKKTSKVKRHQRVNTAMNSLILFTDIAYKITTILAAVMMAITLVGGIYTLVVFLLGHPVPGYTTIMFVVTAAFFGVFAILAIIIKYLSVIVNLIFKKQKYVAESIVKIGSK